MKANWLTVKIIMEILQNKQKNLPEGINGPATVYCEFRIAGPEVEGMKQDVEALAANLKNESAFIALSLKRLVGESTMVKNYPENYKGLLNTSFEDAANGKTLPFFYAIFIRFRDGVQAQKVMNGWFEKTIAPRLHVYEPGKGKTPLTLDYHVGIYQTVSAGNRKEIFQSNESFIDYMSRQEDEPSRGLITVGNQVVIEDQNCELFENRIFELLKTAQKTYRPETNPENGEPGSQTNRVYRSAVTTEILKNAAPNGNLRNYIMHGTWESFWDHENSHLDERFMRASMPVGALVVGGPFEPFYKTEILVTE
jgi:hypothetical protein